MKALKLFSPPPPPDAGMFDVAVGPHYRAGKGLASIHQRWILALTPAIAASLFFFGLPALRIFGLCVCFSVALDLFSEKIAPSRDLTSNWSSVSLALVFACMMPLDSPWWLLLVGCFIMIIVGKKFFGGVGAYPVHPAVLGLAVLQVSWPARMDYTAALKDTDLATTMIEPLRLLKSLGVQAADMYHWHDLLLGRQVAGTANGMVLFIIIGGILLLAMREIQWQGPAGFLAGFIAAAGVLHFVFPAAFVSPEFYLLSGGTAFMALFLITDHTTSPVNKKPLFAYGVLAGVLLVLIRGYSKHVDGITFAVLLVNLCAPLIDMIKPKIKGDQDV